jgi:hypothetical protein
MVVGVAEREEGEKHPIAFTLLEIKKAAELSN